MVIDLLDNIKFFCPNSTVVLYNGGDNPELCKDLGVLVCPTSRKLKYGITAIYLLETMKWLDDIQFEYDYLINLDSDALFFREGYEPFIAEQMKNKDYMGVETKPLESNNYCGIQLRKEFSMWEPLFCTKPLYESFNVGQVFSKQLVTHFLTSSNFELLQENLNKSNAFGIDEISYVTMTERFGYKLNAYPLATGNSIRYRPYFQLDETVRLLHRNKNGFLLHPVRRDMLDETRTFINKTINQQLQHNSEKSKHLLNPGIVKRNTPTIDHVDSYTTLETKSGNLEAICRTGHQLFHFTWDEHNRNWISSKAIADGIMGTPMILESSYGNFEVVAPLQNGGLGHWWRNNHHPQKTWSRVVRFGQGEYQQGILVENNDKQLTVIVEVKDGYRYFVRDDGKSWKWMGPFI